MNWSDKSEVMKELEVNPLNLAHAAAELRDDPEVVLHAIRKDDSAFEFASDRLKNDADFVLAAMRISKIVILKAGNELKAKKEFITEASKIYSSAISNAHADLRGDAAYVLSLFDKVDTPSFLVGRCTDKVKNNEEVIYKLIELGENNLFYNIPKVLKRKREFILRIVKGHLDGTIKNTNCMFSSKSGLWVVAYYIKKYGGSDKDLLLQALALDGTLLQHAADELRRDPEVLRVAIRQNDLAAQYVSEEFKSKPEICKMLADKHSEHQAFIYDNLIKAMQSGYIEPNAEQVELLEQIKCNGLVQLSRKKVKNASEPEFKAVESKYVLERGVSDLAIAVENFFRDEMALFEYNIFYPKTAAAKGVIIQHYGGYGDFDFHYVLPSAPDSRQRVFLQEGYIVINLSTHDNWQTLFQGEQATENSKEGIALLNKTILQLLLFAQATKIRFAGVPLIYFGASFGGFKGALVNLLLSNKNSLEQLNVKGLFNRLLPLLKQCDANLFAAYILHDGSYDYLSRLGMDKLPNAMQNETLILQNFDDDRVPLSAALNLLKGQFDHNASPDTISFYLTPRAASRIRQVPEKSLGTSTDAHFVPESEKYQKAYYNAIRKFLTSLGRKQSAKVALTSIRLDQAKLFRDCRPSLYDSMLTIHIFRLYYALLQLDDNAMSKRADRLRLLFSLFAYDQDKEEKPVAYKNLLLAYGSWLLTKVVKRNSALRRYFFTQSRNKTNNLGLFQLKPIQEKESAKQKDTTDGFVLTQDAIEYLKNISDPFPLIQRCSQFAIRIDKAVLEFFASHADLKNIDDLQKLWDLGATPLPLTMELVAASRVLSLMKQYYPDQDERAKAIICLQGCEPFEVIYHLGVHKFKLEELQYLADKLRQLAALDRIPFIRSLAGLCSCFTDKLQAIDWLMKIDTAKRRKIVKRYKVAVSLFKFINEAKLTRVQEHPELLDTDFLHSAVALNKFTQ